MWRSLLVLFAAVPLFAAPVPKDKDVLYFPVKEGTVRVYEVKTDSLTEESTETVTKVEPKGDAYLVTVLEKTGKDKGTSTVLEVSGKGIVRVKTEFSAFITALVGDVDTVPPEPILKIPAKAGDTWTTEGSATKGEALKATYKVGKEEEVEVPAGKFKAIPIELVTGLDGQPPISTSTTWYSPGVGVVKSRSKLGKLEYTRVLKSITEGK